MEDGHVTREQAIEAAERLMARDGYQHGPCLSAKELVTSPIIAWLVEFAHDGYTEHSKTCDPSSIELEIAINGDEVRELDWCWNRDLPHGIIHYRP